MHVRREPATRSPTEADGDLPAPWRHVMVIGLALGALSHLGDELPGAWGVVGNIGGPWIAVAFWVGSRGGRAAVASRRAVAALVVALGGYYATKRLLDPGPIALDLLRRDGARWLVLAAVAGPIFGCLGAAWRSANGWWRVAAAAVLGGALIGEGLRLPWLFFPGVVVGALAAVEVATGLAVAWALSPSARREAVVALAAVTGACAFVAIGWLVGALPTLLRPFP